MVDDARKSPARHRPQLMAVVTFLALLLPIEVEIFSLLLMPGRVLFLILVPVTLINLLRGKYGRMLPADFLVMGYCLWMVLSIAVNNFETVVTLAGMKSNELLGGYLAGRAFVRTKGEFIGLVKMLALAVLISLPFALHETITSVPVIPTLIDSLPFVDSHKDIQHEPRLGLWRVQWLFVHPIHYGLFCSLAFALAFAGLENTIGTFRRYVATFIIAVCVFLSLSSGAVLSVGFQGALIVWYMITRQLPKKWLVLFLIGLFLYIVLDLMTTRSALYTIAERLAFNPRTAWVRRILWEHGMAQVWRTPLLGIGFNTFQMPSYMTGSIDNFWLLMALVYGVPAFLMYLAMVAGSMLLIGNRDFTWDPEMEALRRGWIISIVGICLTLGTVAIWGAMESIVMFIFASGLWMSHAEKPKEDGEAESTEAPAPTTRYTRFAPAAPAAPEDAPATATGRAPVRRRPRVISRPSTGLIR